MDHLQKVLDALLTARAELNALQHQPTPQVQLILEKTNEIQCLEAQLGDSYIILNPLPIDGQYLVKIYFNGHHFHEELFESEQVALKYRDALLQYLREHSCIIKTDNLNYVMKPTCTGTNNPPLD